MFYDARSNDHGLPHDPMKALIVPRPVGWISSLDEGGRVNLAPYSFFNAVGERPYIVVIGSTGWKHTAGNLAATGEFVCNLATYDLRDAVNRSSAPVPAGVDEMALAGLTPAASRLVKPPRVGESPVALECKVLEVKRLVDLEGTETASTLLLGQVVGVHIDEGLIVDGLVDITRARPISRLGYMDYAVIDEVFQMRRPQS
ncbi:flavin reductase family protein [Lutibaculum baratangense]|uniref:Nitrilotriacetate monooxygenase component B n=1 Tax=Lutibaculum baratangense AMV1 TaxID=631454 RepID=V4QUZ4_9HYPH|nr:flavin reductase family protein [Lutibaculum baratangense]ESR23572.1 Nitrilotriacetate monooxygenase component B [Lutibaculum baratangense AMV1]